MNLKQVSSVKFNRILQFSQRGSPNSQRISTFNRIHAKEEQKRLRGKDGWREDCKRLIRSYNRGQEFHASLIPQESSQQKVSLYQALVIFAFNVKFLFVCISLENFTKVIFETLN
jgi:hypothetical protein